jgi:hypothetical protein
MKTYAYDTVSQAINDFAIRGYNTEFELLAEEDCLLCNKTSIKLSSEEFVIDEIYRFKEETNSREEKLVYAISSKQYNLKGTLITSFEKLSDNNTSKTIELLRQRAEKKPIKRDENIQPFSRDHHHGLLLSWKIKTGFKKNIEVERIKRYTDWFYKNRLLPHFEAEEKFLFPILGNDHELIKKAVSEHQNLKNLFESTTDIAFNLHQIETDLNQHIRFEERVLFNEIQSIATPEQLNMITELHQEEKFVDNASDPFWE